MYQKILLPNGIRVVSEVIPSVKSVALGIWIGTGSRQEKDFNHGISHFIEHLMFKGSATQTARDIAEKVDAIGGQLNAFTAKEYTCYYMKVLDSHLEFAFEMLSDMLLASKFDANDIEREREVILEEVHMYEDTPDELVHDIHLDAIWNSHPLGRNILGSISSLYDINREKVINYYKQHYTSQNMVIAIAGNFEHAAMLSFAEKYFGSLSGDNNKEEQFAPKLIPAKVVRTKEIEQSHICISFPSVQQNSPEIYSIHVLNNILGGSVSSRLFQSIREENGLAYSVYSYQTNYSDTGLFSIYAGTRPNNAEQVTQLILKNIVDLKTGDISNYEFTKAKEQLKGSLLLGLESTSSRMSRLGKMELVLGKHFSLDDVVERIDRVTIEEVKQMADNIFKLENLGFTALGPVGEELISAITRI